MKAEQPIHDDTFFFINNSKDEPVMVENNPGQRPRVIEFGLGLNFYDRGHFHDVIKEFVLVINIELKHRKTDRESHS